jgi:hypothetical protein
VQILAGSGDLVLMTALVGLGRLLLELRRASASELAALACRRLAAAGSRSHRRRAVAADRRARAPRAARGPGPAHARLLVAAPESLVDLAVPRLVSDAPLSTADRAAPLRGARAALRLPLRRRRDAGAGRARPALHDRARTWPLAAVPRSSCYWGSDGYTPVYALLLQVPGFSLLRYPQKYLLPARSAWRCWRRPEPSRSHATGQRRRASRAMRWP